MKICEWLPFPEKPVPKNPHEVLCAWKKGNGWVYEVWIHWPDGVWTDGGENDMETEIGALPPVFWMDIPQP
ncbi:MAG: hypothetical protein ACYCQL_00630 [Acidithiobacillus sp.]